MPLDYNTVIQRVYLSLLYLHRLEWIATNSLAELSNGHLYFDVHTYGFWQRKQTIYPVKIMYLRGGPNNFLGLLCNPSKYYYLWLGNVYKTKYVVAIEQSQEAKTHSGSLTQRSK